MQNAILINEDFLKAKIDKATIDLIVTSPPYNLSIDYNTYDDEIAYEEYLQWTEKWLAKALTLSKEDGRMCVNIPLEHNKNGRQSMYADFVSLAKKAGWKYQSSIIWNKANVSKRTAWGSWLSASAPYVTAPVEMIVVFYKNIWKKHSKGESDITKEEFIEWTNGLWTFPGESKKKVEHPAPFPITLPTRCIKLFSYVNDTVLDPFMGSGTTVVAAKRFSRKAIGVELDNKYFKLATKRIRTQSLTLL